MQVFIVYNMKVKYPVCFTIKEEKSLREIYLDNSATTKVCESGIEKATEMMRENYGNPSSLHDKGFQSQKEIENARKIIAKELSTESDEIYFTSGGTESNNLAIFGSVNSMRRRGNKIVTTAIEHSSVYASCKELEENGFQVVYLQPDATGCIKKEQILSAIDEDTILVSLMMVNNEVGSILPVEEVRKCIEQKHSPAIFHVDAVQAFGKIPVKANKIKADLISISAHKVHAPKGVGVLYKAKNKRIHPIIFGGEQQDKIRPGTESAPLIAAFGAAVSEFELEKNYEKATLLKEYLTEQLSKIDGIMLNSGENALPYVVNFSTGNIKAETMLHFLSSRGVYVSGGSACAKGKKSRVLKALGFDDKRITSSIRVSFSKYNTKDDIDGFIFYLKEGINTLVKS